jgi:Fibrobacter succinogenes major domain (Fib_succ_major).
MAIWTGEINELNKVYSSFKGNLPDIMKEMEQLIRTDDPNVVMLYSRRCLEVIITDLCEIELKRPRKTEPLKGIIDKLNSEEKVPPYIITSMLSLNSMANYGAHPKDFDPEQVRPVLNNLNIIIKWYLKYKDFKVVSKTDIEEEKHEKALEEPVKAKPKSWKKSLLVPALIFVMAIFLFSFLVSRFSGGGNKHHVDNLSPYNFVDPRDNEPYNTVKIGDQIWMAENLKAVKFNDGTPIPLVKDKTSWQNLQTPGYCWYNNHKRTFRETYGALYNWYAVNSGSLCPAGWSVPADSDWTKLGKFVGDSIDWMMRGDTVPLPEVAGIKLKEAGNNHWLFRDSIFSTDDFGFKALPAGDRTIYGVFWGINQEGSWWSSTEVVYDKRDAKNRELDFDANGITDIEQYKQTGMSVRCIKN